MTEAAALELRHVRLAEPVTLRPASLGATPEEGGEEGVFVALDDSPPVRTVLAVVEGGRRRALEVAWVVEVAEGPTTRGFYGRWVSDEALERAAKVGTEHLEDGMPVVQPVVYDNSAVLDVSDTSMAMPAPVIVLDDDTGVVDVDDEDDGEARHEASAPEGEASAAPTEALAAAETATSEDAVRAEDPAGDAEQASDAAEQSSSNEQAEATDADDAAETSTDSGEAPSESGDGDASQSRSKGSRKKRGRRRR